MLQRDQAVAAMQQAPPWREYDLSDLRVVRLNQDSAVLVYRVQARRDGQDLYVAMASSAFVRHPGGWRLAFHQQTPVD
jgi:hypothetical protein